MPKLCAEPGPPAQLYVLHEDGCRMPLHPLWLRERCRDPASIDPRTEQRLFDPSDLDPALTIDRIVETGPGWLEVTFSDGHRDRFAEDAILAEAGMAPGNDGLPARQSWASGLRLPTARWHGRFADAALYDIVETFLRYGFVILKGVPCVPDTILTVARTFGFPRETNFGVLFNVRSAPDANDLAYTALALDPHTDNPYRAPVPGIQILHCLTNETSGGLSTLVDGLSVVEALRVRAPDAFRILTTTPVRFRYVDRATEHVGWAPLIELDVSGRMQAIHFSPRLDFVPLLPPDALSTFYGARRLLDRMLKSAEFEIRFRLDDGDLVMFDNRRLLHGRTTFDPSEGLRHLQGCYIDIDGPRSLYRVLRRRLTGQQTAGQGSS